MAQDSGSVSGDVNSDFVQWQFILSVRRSFSFLTSTMGSNLGPDAENQMWKSLHETEGVTSTTEVARPPP